MLGHLRVKNPVKQLLILIAVFSPQLLILIFAAVLAQQSEIKVEEINVSSDKMKFLQGFYSVTFFFLPAFLYAVFVFTGKYFWFLGFKPAQKPGMYILAPITIVAALFFAFWLGQLNERIPLPHWMKLMEENTSKQMNEFLKVKDWGDIFINIIVIALLPAICEEIFFRGAVQRVMIHVTRSPWIGIIISAFLFSALHMQFVGFLPRMFLGLVLGALYWYSGSLWVCIIAHFVNNALQVIWVSFSPESMNSNPAIPFWLTLMSGIVVALLLYVYRNQSKVSYAKVYEPDSLHRDSQFLA